MEIRDLQEKYNEALDFEFENRELADDLEVEFWGMIKDLLDNAGIVYEKSSQSEAVYLQCATELDEDGEIEDYFTVRVATHENSYAQSVNYIERDFEDMYHRLEQLLKTQKGLYCEL